VNAIVTGFEPWDSHAVNPSGEVARALGGVELPVDFRAADRVLRQLIRRRRPDALLMLGLADSRKSLSLEAVALNVDHHEGAGKNDAWRRPIQKGGPLAIESRLPLKDLQVRLKKSGIPASISHHAGTFLCNHVFYRGLSWMDGPCGFVHLPQFRELSRSRMIQAVRVILQAIGGSSRAATP
jgi:pyroglutamyl-peptidase